MYPYAPPRAPLAAEPVAAEEPGVNSAGSRIDLYEIVRSYDRTQIVIRMLRGLECVVGGVALLFLGLGVLEPAFFIAAVILLAVAAGFEYGRRRLAAGSLRAARVLCGIFGLMFLLSISVPLFDLAGVGAGAAALIIGSVALNAMLYGLLLVGCMEPIRERARAWRAWTAGHGASTQREHWFSFLGLPVVPPGKGRRRALVLTMLAVVAEAFSFASYMGISNRMAKVAERDPDITFGGAFMGFLFGMLVAMLIARLGFAISRRLRNRARRHLIRSADEAMATDSRPPVLFLRSFADDQVSLQTAEIDWKFLDPGASAGTLDELIIRCWAVRAPVVAIGSPGDQSVPVGAARHYVSGEPWEEAVQRLAKKSTAIVVGISATEGVLWEVALVASSGLLGKTVFIVPPAVPARAELLRKVGDKLGVALDEPADGRRRVVAFFRQGDGAYLIFTSTRPTELDYELALRRFQMTITA